jgi:hypothetical protein
VVREPGTGAQEHKGGPQSQQGRSRAFGASQRLVRCALPTTDLAIAGFAGQCALKYVGVWGCCALVEQGYSAEQHSAVNR